MGGRFLSASVFVSAIVLSQIKWMSFFPARVGTLTLFVSLGFLATTPTVLSGSDYHNLKNHSGIGDIRGRKYQKTGLLRPDKQIEKRKNTIKGRQLRKENVKLFVTASIGFTGFYAGPNVHIIDQVALSDPFLARLPAARPWAIAHFSRPIPEGYLETVEQGKNLIKDPHLAELYDKIRLVVSSSNLFTWERWRAMWFLNFGNYKQLIKDSQLPTKKYLN